MADVRWRHGVSWSVLCLCAGRGHCFSSSTRGLKSSTSPVHSSASAAVDSADSPPSGSRVFDSPHEFASSTRSGLFNAVSLSSGLVVSLSCRHALRQSIKRRRGGVAVVRSAKEPEVLVVKAIGNENGGVTKEASATAGESGWGWQGKVVQPAPGPAKPAQEDVPAATSGLLAVPPWFRGSDDCKLIYAAKEKYGRLAPQGPYDAGGMRSKKVVLSVFDVSGVVPDKDKNYLKDMCSRPVDGFWHISIKAFGHNVDNPRMIDGILPSTLAPFLRYQFLMDTDRTVGDFLAAYEERRREGVFDLSQYDMKDNNCNHFQADLIKFLAGPNRQVGPLVEADEVLSPLDFGRNAPPPEELRRLNKIANHAVMRGMLRRRREARRQAKEQKMWGAASAVGTLGLVGAALKLIPQGFNSEMISQGLAASQ